MHLHLDVAFIEGSATIDDPSAMVRVDLIGSQCIDQWRLDNLVSVLSQQRFQVIERDKQNVRFFRGDKFIEFNLAMRAEQDNK
jgi:hypothetical protein